MRYVTNFVQFWYDFIVGDDWTVAVGVICALIVAAVLTRLGLDIWWWMPIVVVALLASSVWRVAIASRE